MPVLMHFRKSWILASVAKWGVHRPSQPRIDDNGNTSFCNSRMNPREIFKKWCYAAVLKVYTCWLEEMSVRQSMTLEVWLSKRIHHFPVRTRLGEGPLIGLRDVFLCFPSWGMCLRHVWELRRGYRSPCSSKDMCEWAHRMSCSRGGYPDSDGIL